MAVHAIWEEVARTTNDKGCSERVDFSHSNTKRSRLRHRINSGLVSVVVMPSEVVRIRVSNGGEGFSMKDSRSNVSRAEMIVERQRE